MASAVYTDALAPIIILPSTITCVHIMHPPIRHRCGYLIPRVSHTMPKNSCPASLIEVQFHLPTCALIMLLPVSRFNRVALLQDSCGEQRSVHVSV